MERMASIESVSKDQPSTGSGAVRQVPAGWCLSSSKAAYRMEPARWRLSSSKAAYRRLPSGRRVSPSNPFNTIRRMSDTQPGQNLSVVYLNQSTKRASMEFKAIITVY
ncbi:hypothetical protein [Ravibacter arvi]|uniref:hypothetical protein n=1 Tax=Ravibacter arvi TaxID=2051041 RepID=UPI0031E840ED